MGARMDVGEEMGGGTISDIFKVSGHGIVLIFLWAQCTGKVMAGGVVESTAGRALIKSIDGGVRTLNNVPTLGVLVDAEAAPLFAKGQVVKFYKAP